MPKSKARLKSAWKAPRLRPRRLRKPQLHLPKPRPRKTKEEGPKDAGRSNGTPGRSELRGPKKRKKSKQPKPSPGKRNTPKPRSPKKQPRRPRRPKPKRRKSKPSKHRRVIYFHQAAELLRGCFIGRAALLTGRPASL